MFYKTMESDVQASQELIVLCHQQRRLLIPLPETYEDAIDVARRKFSLDGTLCLITKSLPGSVGFKVEIDSSAWIGIKSILSSVIVEHVCTTDEQDTLEHAHSRSLIPRPSFTQSRVVVHEEGAVPPAALLVSRRTSRTSLAPGPSRRVSAARQSLFRRSRVQPPPNGDVLEVDGSGDDGDGSYVSGVPDDARNEEDEFLLSPSKAKLSKRLRVYSDDEREDHHDLPKAPSVKDESITPNIEEEIQILDESPASWRAPTETAEPRVQTPPPPPSPPPATKPISAKEATKTPRTQKPSSTHEKSAKANKVADKSQSSDFVPSSQPQGDDKIVVIIEYDDGTRPESETQMLFKTRGRHLVSKVLWQACRTFGIEGLYDSARLVLLVEMEESNGQVVEHRYLCAPEDTMIRAGAEPQARFAIEIGED